MIKHFCDICKEELFRYGTVYLSFKHERENETREIKGEVCLDCFNEKAHNLYEAGFLGLYEEWNK